MTTPERFSAWLKEQLHGRRLTALKLAEALDVAYPDVLDWVDGWTVPPPSICRRIAELFDVPVDQVLALAGWQQG